MYSRLLNELILEFRGDNDGVIIRVRGSKIHKIM